MKQATLKLKAIHSNSHESSHIDLLRDTWAEPSFSTLVPDGGVDDPGQLAWTSASASASIGMPVISIIVDGRIYSG
jgi:hypothetical protein